jgi:RNA polymerase sigma-70 factor (ECF subfamily)
MATLTRPTVVDFPPPALADKALVQKMLDGDQGAFDDFCEEHFSRLYRFSLTRLDRDPDLALEVTQATIVKAIESLENYRGEAPLSAWLYTICRYEISAYYRKKKRTPAMRSVEDLPDVDAALSSLSLELANPEDELSQKELTERVHAALDRLPTHYGNALEWKYFEGLSVVEIAARMKTGPKAVESLLTRARNAFRDGFTILATAR